MTTLNVPKSEYGEWFFIDGEAMGHITLLQRARDLGFVETQKLSAVSDAIRFLRESGHVVHFVRQYPAIS
jgi:hypothetical protein